MDDPESDSIYRVLENYNFVEEITIEDIMCSLCKQILKNAYSAPCGCRYCFKCISNYLETNKKNCPGNTDDCKAKLIELKENVFVDNFTNHKISKLIVKCPGKSCKFKDELKNIEKHLRICNLISNNRTLQCPYFKIGCIISESTDINLNEHLQNATLSHVTLLMEFIDNINNETNLLKEIIDKLKKENENLSARKSETNEKYEIEFSKINQDIELLKISKADETEIDMRNKELQNNYEQLNDQFTEINNKYQQIVKHILITKKEIENDRNLIINIDEKENKNDITMQLIQSKLLEIEIQQNILNYGEFVWRIDKFTDKITDAKNGIIKNLYSNHFYSHKYGYKLCLKVYPDGWAGGKSTHLSIYFCLMKGEYDDILEWPFKYSVRCSLINQQTLLEYNTAQFENHDLSNCKDLNKPISEKNGGLGFPRFLELNDLLNNKDLISNDQIFIKCTVSI